jgi:hypothetical protein
LHFKKIKNYKKIHFIVKKMMGWSFLQKKEVKKNRFFQSVFEKLLNFFNF